MKIKSSNCDRCGVETEKFIRGSHVRDEGDRPFQICFKCDDDVFFNDIPWSDLSAAAKKARIGGTTGRQKIWASLKEKNAFHNAKRRTEKKAAE